MLSCLQSAWQGIILLTCHCIQNLKMCLLGKVSSLGCNILDLTKKFKTVDHKILWCQGTHFNWFRNYLSPLSPVIRITNEAEISALQDNRVNNRTHCVTSHNAQSWACFVYRLYLLYYVNYLLLYWWLVFQCIIVLLWIEFWI